MLFIRFIDRLDDSIGSFICQVGMNHEQCVNDTRHPEEKRKEDADDALNWLSTKEDS